MTRPMAGRSNLGYPRLEAMKSDANGVGSLASPWKTIREAFWTKVIYLFICIGTISGCAAAHSKTDCNDEAERNFLGLYAAITNANEIYFKRDGAYRFTEEEVASRTAAGVAVQYIICIDSATTDHAEPNIPLQPIWERLEFEL